MRVDCRFECQRPSAQGGNTMDLTATLSDCIRDVLHALAEQGFELPLHVTCLGRNGTMMYFSYDAKDDDTDSLEATLVAKHSHESGVALPINLFFVDARGEAARVVIDANGRIPD